LFIYLFIIIIIIIIFFFFELLIYFIYSASQFYYKMIKKTEENRDFIFKEYERVSKILGKLKVEDQFYDDFKTRLNILEVFRSSALEAIEIEKETTKSQHPANEL